MASKNSGKKKKKSKASNAVFIVIIVILAGIMCYAGYRVISALTTYNTAKGYYEDIRGEIDSMFETEEDIPDESDESTQPTTNEKGETAAPAPVKKKAHFNFGKLLEINPEAVAYMKARGVSGDDVLDYPVVQGTDNTYYLTHMFNGEYNKSGAIFIDSEITERFDSSNCIIYGHNMYAGAKMFSCLENYADQNYAEEHKEVDIYTADKHYVYKVFSAFTADTAGFAYQYGFSDNEDFMNYIRTALELRPFDMGVGIEDFNADSKIITLSTCLTDYRSDKRYVVMFLRTEEEENTY